MKITKVENPKEFPTIVKIKNDYYVVSEPFGINDNIEMSGDSRIAINLKDGKWFDFTEFEDMMQAFAKGTIFEIEI